MLVRLRTKQMTSRMFDVLEPWRPVLTLKGGCHPMIWIFYRVRIEAFEPLENELL